MRNTVVAALALYSFTLLTLNTVFYKVPVAICSIALTQLNRVHVGGRVTIEMRREASMLCSAAVIE